jgi:predicted RNase H-like HicB family nuclease
MKYIYPVVFTHSENAVEVEAPDLPGVFTFGDDMADALSMAQDAMAMWLDDAERQGKSVAPASALDDVTARFAGAEQTVQLVAVDTDRWRRENQSVKKTIRVPLWINEEVKALNKPFSTIARVALERYLQTASAGGD